MGNCPVTYLSERNQLAPDYLGVRPQLCPKDYPSRGNNDGSIADKRGSATREPSVKAAV